MISLVFALFFASTNLIIYEIVNLFIVHQKMVINIVYMVISSADETGISEENKEELKKVDTKIMDDAGEVELET